MFEIHTVPFLHALAKCSRFFCGGFSCCSLSKESSPNVFGTESADRDRLKIVGILPDLATSITVPAIFNLLPVYFALMSICHLPHFVLLLTAFLSYFGTVVVAIFVYDCVGIVLIVIGEFVSSD